MEDNGYFLYLDSEIEYGKECVVFDYDGTLAVKANSDKPWLSEKNPENFILLYGVRRKILKYIKQDIHVFILSNQKYMTDAKEQMFLHIYEIFHRKISICVANRQNMYRKPDTGIIDIIKQNYKILFYCGDAVGNTSDFPPYQFENTDLKLAENAEIPFKTPMEVFASNFYTYIPKAQVVIMMGMQGSGKTSFSKRIEIEDFVRFSQDEFGDLIKNINEIEEDVRKGKSVVLDATHRKHSLRQIFIDMAERNDASWVICWCVRDGRPFNELRENPIHPAGIALYVREFERPVENFIVIN